VTAKAMLCMQSRDALFLKSLMEVVSRPSQNNGAVVLSNLLADAREVQKGNLCSKLSKVGKKDAAAEEMESHDDVSSDASDDYYRAVHSSRSIGRAGTGLNAVLGNAADYRSYATLLNADLKKQTKHRCPPPRKCPFCAFFASNPCAKHDRRGSALCWQRSPQEQGCGRTLKESSATNHGRKSMGCCADTINACRLQNGGEGNRLRGVATTSVRVRAGPPILKC